MGEKMKRRRDLCLKLALWYKAIKELATSVIANALSSVYKIGFEYDTFYDANSLNKEYHFFARDLIPVSQDCYDDVRKENPTPTP